jgi:hypothetical protein
MTPEQRGAYAAGMSNRNDDAVREPAYAIAQVRSALKVLNRWYTLDE